MICINTLSNTISQSISKHPPYGTTFLSLFGTPLQYPITKENSKYSIYMNKYLSKQD